MERNQHTGMMWTCLGLDKDLIINEFLNPDDRLFFGKRPALGQTIYDAAGEQNRSQVEIIMAGIRRSLDEKRHSCLVYLSDYAARKRSHVCGHVEYHDDGSVRLYLTALDINDMETARKSMESEVPIWLNAHTIYDELPIGVEIYNREGRLIEINLQGVRSAGVASKEAVLGILLFDNPLMTEEVKSRLLAGENVRTTVEYDYDALKEYVDTVRDGVRHLDMSVWITRNQAGEIDKYIVISQDVTEQTQLKKKYESLYKQNTTILDSLPIGVAVYSPSGAMLYFNESAGRIFGTDAKTAMENPVNFFESPVIPESVKNAVRTGVSVRGCFPYDFRKAKDKGYYPFTKSETRQMECTGCPIVSADGKVESYIFIIDDATEKIAQDEILRQNRRKTEIAMQAADIMFWEFDVATNLFYSDNEPMNGYDLSKPMTIDQYLSTIDDANREKMTEIMNRMQAGEDFSFDMDAFVLFPDNPEWQYCSINGSPYEIGERRKVTKYVGTRKNNMDVYKRRQLQDKILNSLPISIHIKDIENDFRYLFCNDESKRLFGTSEDGTTYDVMEADKVRLIRKTDLEVYNTGIPYTGQERVELKNGTVYETIVRKNIIEDNGRRLLLSTRWDQSLQNELERRSQLFSLTLETMNAYTWFYEPDKQLINFGDGFDKLGQRAMEINALDKYFECLHPDDVQMFSDSLESALAQESGVWKVEYRCDLRGKGVYEWWETRGIVETTLRSDIPYKYMYGMTICIEPYKQTEMTLINNKEELNQLVRQNELILNNSNSGLAYITTDYIVQWENVSECSTSITYEAYKKNEPCYKSAHGRDTPCENCVMQRAIASGQMEQIQFTLENNRQVEIFATPVFIDDRIDGIVIRVDDITDRQHMIEELQQAKAQAEQSDKLKSAFLANMSHEIRTPLNAIVGFSELLLTAPEDEEREEYITIINNNNELLLKLINDILDLSKIEAGVVEFKYEEFDLADYFNGIASSMTQRVTNPNVRLIAVNPYESCRVNLDRNRVAQLFTNYVTNAIKYTPKGFIEMGYECIDGGVRFYVKDTGIGIPEEKKSKVFHRFAKLDEFAQGTGLGLSICKAIAETMGGKVGFESQDGEGSLFWAFLPCEPVIGTAPEENNPKPTTSDSPGAPAGVAPDASRKTILIAEDIQSNYLLLSTLLRKQYNILWAHNGQEAVDMARTEHVDVVLMDMKMPVMDGMTATREIRKFAPKLPIVALTAHAFEADKVAALAAGCDDYLVKPLDKPRLNAVLEKYCSESLKPGGGK